MQISEELMEVCGGVLGRWGNGATIIREREPRFLRYFVLFITLITEGRSAQLMSIINPECYTKLHSKNICFMGGLYFSQ